MLGITLQLDDRVLYTIIPTFIHYHLLLPSLQQVYIQKTPIGMVYLNNRGQIFAIFTTEYLHIASTCCSIYALIRSS